MSHCQQVTVITCHCHVTHYPLWRHACHRYLLCHYTWLLRYLLRHCVWFHLLRGWQSAVMSASLTYVFPNESRIDWIETFCTLVIKNCGVTVYIQDQMYRLVRVTYTLCYHSRNVTSTRLFFKCNKCTNIQKWCSKPWLLNVDSTRNWCQKCKNLMYFENKSNPQLQTVDYSNPWAQHNQKIGDWRSKRSYLRRQINPVRMLWVVIRIICLTWEYNPLCSSIMPPLCV